MPELNERTKVSLAAVAWIFTGALTAQGWSLVALSGKASTESVEAVEAHAEERYVRKDVLAESLKGLNDQLAAMRAENIASRAEITSLRVEVAGLRARLEPK